MPSISRFFLGTSAAALMIVGAASAQAEELTIAPATQVRTVVTTVTTVDPSITIVAAHDISEQHEDLFEDAASLLAGTAAAYHLLDMTQMDMAMKQLGEAREAAQDIIARSPTPRVGGQMTFARTSYSYAGAEKDVLFAMAGDDLAVDDYDDIVKRRANIGFAVKDSQARRYNFEINPTLTLAAIDAALASGRAGDAPAAMAAVEQIYRSSLSGPVAFNNTLQAAYDNMAMARAFIDEGSFHEARSALGHAGAALQTFENEPAGRPYAPSVQDIHKQISGLQSVLAREDRRTLSRAERRVDEWMDNMRGWAVLPN